MTRYSRLPDSPSRQLIQELTRDLEQVRIHNAELKQVRAYERKSFYEKLDRIEREREAEHNAGLAAAAARHEEVRREAEETLKEHLRQVEEERQRKEEAERRERERIAREKAEKERREREEAERIAAAKRAQEEAARKKAEEEERARKAAEEEKQRKENERIEQEKKKQDEERQRLQNEEAARKAADEKKKSRALGGAHRTPQEIAEQQRYVELHQHLKKFRKYMTDLTKSNPTLKQHMGDMRRTIKKCVGQLTEAKGANRQPTAEVATVLRTSLQLAEPSVDVRQFIAFPPAHISNAETATVPALFIYLLNIYSKAVIAHLVTEAGAAPKYGEPLGVMTALIFSNEAFHVNGHPMIDILISKFRVVCPLLWGFYGDERTDEGKSAIGWWREEANGPFINQQLHVERMTGLGAGYAAIALRNFSKSQRKNPYPTANFWKAVVNIVSVPPEEVQSSHLLVLYSLLRFAGVKVPTFFGDMGVMLLRRALIEFPASLKGRDLSTGPVELLREIYYRDHNIVL
ncbi:hypothetical protein FQN54_001980 [Arachnomyces sp. PD_36]|nr:hypothetical protein FQN54_001980 [Arachnomyces sp. PD_36]